MARPRKRRHVRGQPHTNRFGPLGSRAALNGSIDMELDEYETIRLIDLEGLTQEECALQMKVARTTVQGIYGEARKKIAESLVNGKMLQIGGGDVHICEGDQKGCEGGRKNENRSCKRKRNGV
ncbi:MAG: DUF134 domain-containing protein [Anaerovoracaceae bacterium]|jgi:predicted DNA-binding protein (UPF0251 family)